MRRILAAFAVSLWSVLAWPTAGGATYIDSNLAVSVFAHANGGGCYPVSIAPGLLDMLTLIDPEWAAIDVGSHLPPFSDPVTVHGTVALTKVNEGGDFPGSHQTDDQNTFITVDTAELGLVGTGNVGPAAVEDGNMEVEWEIGKYPLFAWAGTGDRLTAVGRWIWDCGHPSPNPAGNCSVTMTEQCYINADCAPPHCPTCVTGETCMNVVFNYHSEVHPPQAVAVTRTGGYKYSPRVRPGRRLSTRTDVWISPDGGGTGDACILTHLPNSATLLGTDCFPFSQPVANVNAGNFAFDIALPPRPASQMLPPRIRVFDRTPAGFPVPAATATWVPGIQDKIHVVVDMTTPVGGNLPSQVGKTIVAGWNTDPTPITRLSVRVTEIEIVNPLKALTPASPMKRRCSGSATDCSTSACPIGETCRILGGPTPGWQVWLEVNGNWQQLPALQGVQSARTIPLDLRYKVGVPTTGGTLHLHASGKSLGCLEAQLYGQALPTDLALYGFTDGAACLQDSSKDIGKLDLNLTGPDFGSGGGSMTYVTPSIGGDGGTCSTTTSRLCVTADDCPIGETCNVTGSSYKLHYTIRKLR